MGALREIDVDYNFFDDIPEGKDPDSHSPTLRRYHKLLWSKPVPDGRPFGLHTGRARSPYLVYDADSTRIVLGSDTVATRHRKKLHRLYSQLPDEVNAAFLRRSYTICGFMIFPSRRGTGLNQRRGMRPRIQDRWDLTLEAIRRFYEGGASLLATTMDRFATFFELFSSFDGYVDHFLLNDFVDEEGKVRFLLPSDGFESVLPSDLPTYERYRLDTLELFEARRLCILNEIERRCPN